MEINDYITVKDFAKRMGNMSMRNAREELRSKDIRQFTRQRTERGRILVNWTAFQKWYEENAVAGNY